MFIIPSRSRPHNISRLISAWEATGAASDALVRIDSDDPTLEGYKDVQRPENWGLVASKRLPVGEIYNQAFHALPDLSWYGVFADDVVPETQEWDVELIQAAGKDGMAFGDDGINGGKHATHFVLGGDLVRDVGWIGLAGLSRIYIDTVWNDIARDRGVFRYLPDIKITHRHFSNRKALMDATYRKPHKAEDKAVYDRWRKTKELK